MIENVPDSRWINKISVETYFKVRFNLSFSYIYSKRNQIIKLIKIC